MNSRNEKALDIRSIVDAAFRLLDANGLDRLTMRSIASELAVQAPALYWHITNKQEVLKAMAWELYVRAFESVDEVCGWQSWLYGFGFRLRETLKAHRDGGRLCLATARSELWTPRFSKVNIAKPLRQFGFDQHTSVTILSSIIALTVGWSCFEESNWGEHSGDILNLDHAFEHGMKAMITGHALSLQAL